MTIDVPAVPAGTKLTGAIKTAAALGQLLPYGIGDTIRVSLAEDPVEEIPVAYQILSSLDLRHRGPNVIACPSCARTLGFDVIGTVPGAFDHPEHGPVGLHVMFRQLP